MLESPNGFFVKFKGTENNGIYRRAGYSLHDDAEPRSERGCARCLCGMR
jgi:hypothetical protein